MSPEVRANILKEKPLFFCLSCQYTCSWGGKKSESYGERKKELRPQEKIIKIYLRKGQIKYYMGPPKGCMQVDIKRG